MLLPCFPQTHTHAPMPPIMAFAFSCRRPAAGRTKHDLLGAQAHELATLLEDASIEALINSKVSQ
eukprot:1161929-Pelagomonas_calceolata.AAC.5